MNNLPPGVRVTDIPGNRPQDVYHDKCIEAADAELPTRFDEAVALLVKIRDATDATEMADACNDFINLFEVTKEEQAGGRILGIERDRSWVFDEFMAGIEAAGIEAGYFEDPPVQEYEADYDMGDF